MVSTRIEGEKVEVELVGRPGFGPRTSVDPAAVAEGRLKLLSGNGYEHFDLDHYVERDGSSIPVFVWTDRTLIAE